MIMKLVVTSGPTRSCVSAGCSKIIILHGASVHFETCRRVLLISCMPGTFLSSFRIVSQLSVFTGSDIKLSLVSCALTKLEPFFLRL